jgi:hypothetical protein
LTKRQTPVAKIGIQTPRRTTPGSTAGRFDFNNLGRSFI